MVTVVVVDPVMPYLSQSSEQLIMNADMNCYRIPNGRIGRLNCSAERDLHLAQVSGEGEHNL